jgi:hypothetical protein
MKTTQMASGKIALHERGLGVPSPETVRERAMELARIEGRARFNGLDWERAKVEVHGGHPMMLTNDGDAEMIESVSGRDMIMIDHGHHVQNVQFEQADDVIEELVAEGLDEAVHDQMLAAAEMQAEALRDEE